MDHDDIVNLLVTSNVRLQKAEATQDGYEIPFWKIGLWGVIFPDYSEYREDGEYFEHDEDRPNTLRHCYIIALLMCYRELATWVREIPVVSSSERACSWLF